MKKLLELFIAIDGKIWRCREYNVPAVARREKVLGKGVEDSFVIITLKEPHRATESKYILKNLTETAGRIKARCIDEGRNDFGVDADMEVTPNQVKLIMHQPSNTGDYTLTFDLTDLGAMTFLTR